jgi:hypothetical protein
MFRTLFHLFLIASLLAPLAACGGAGTRAPGHPLVRAMPSGGGDGGGY